MIRLKCILCLELMLTLASGVFADITPAPGPSGAGGRFVTVQFTATRRLVSSSADLYRPMGRPVGSEDGLAPTDVPRSERRSVEETAKALPPVPDSASLFLCAVGTLGAWQLGRSARKLHCSNVPDWLHTGGPKQVGHAFALHLPLISASAPCWLPPPEIESPPSCTGRHEFYSCRGGPQHVLGVIGPRAPPLFTL